MGIRYWEVQDDIYVIPVKLIIGDSKACTKHLRREYHNVRDIPEEADGCCAECTSDKGPIYVIWLKDFIWDTYWISTLIHECTHLAFKALGFRGIYDGDNGEAFCYYMEFLTREFLGKLSKHTRRKKK